LTSLKIKKRNLISYFLKVTIAAIILLLSLSLGDGGISYAQEKNKYEKRNERKNKSNRRLKRKGDKGRSNKRKIRAAKFKSRTRQGEKSYKGDVTGRKVVTKTTNRRSNASHAQPNPYAGRKRKTERSVAKKASSSPKFTQRKSESAASASVNPRFSSKGRERAWKGNASGRAIRTRSKRITFSKNKSYQGNNVRSASRPSERAIKSARIAPRSASGNYNVRKRRTPYNAFREKKPWERAFKGDVTGRTFRTKRTVEKPVLQKPPKTRYTNSGGRKGDRPSISGSGGSFRTASRKSERAWKKDISGNKLRIRTSSKPTFSGTQFQIYPKSKSRKGDRAYVGKIKGGNIRSISSRKEKPGIKTSKSSPPGAGAAKGFRFQGNIKSQKPLKGGGSISAGLRNNKGKAIQGQGISGQGIKSARFQGNLKSGKPLKGGGSISAGLRNNKGKAIQGKGISGQGIKSARFQGNLKGGKPLKGGGSISAGLRNNKGKAIQGQGISNQGIKSARFQGNLKSAKALKGGGSIARNNWNNRGKVTTKLSNNEQNRRTRKFQGNIKGGKIAKGGGTLNIHPWNNKGNTVNKPEQSPEGQRASGYTGNVKPFTSRKYDALSSVYKGGHKRKFNYKSNPNADKKSLKVRLTKNRDNSSEFKGNTKPFKGGRYDALSAYYKGNDKRKFDYRKNPNSAKESLKVKQALTNDKQAGRYQGNLKAKLNYKHNPTSADDALKVKYPKKNYFQGGNFTGRTKVTWKYKQNPLAADESLKSIPTGAGAVKGSKFQGRTKVTWTYKQNPNASKESLKNLPPSKATAKGSRFEGRFKMAKKYSNKPNASKGALKGIGPSRAAISAGNYQGNIKMSSKRIEDRHPSFNYSRNNNNSMDEKAKLFSIKLLFAKWFKKNEGQPDNLKEKERRPRFDKRERDIWYD
jgi:hypothetical protein